MIDPLLRDLPRPAATEPGLLTVPGAIGRARLDEPDQNALEAAWQTRREYRLVAWVDDADRPAAMDRLLRRWREGVPAEDDPDTSAGLLWPSRDTAMTPVFLAHGLVPKTVVAVRPAGRTYPRGGGAEIRVAGPEDAEAVARLELEVMRWDEQFGATFPRDSTPEAVRREVARPLATRPSWTWLAYQGDRPVGVLQVSPPQESSWIAHLVDRAPVAYLASMGVSGAQRGHGVGAALVATAHATLDAAGVSVTLLHYAALNPLSGPFWHRAGYRPLWTTWHARPAGRLC